MKIVWLCLFLALLASARAEGEFSDQVIEISDQDHLESLKDGTYFLYIYAPWCGFCKRTIPIISQLAGMFEGTGIKVVAVDGDAHKDIAIRFFIEGFPSIYLYKRLISF